MKTKIILFSVLPLVISFLFFTNFFTNFSTAPKSDIQENDAQEITNSVENSVIISTKDINQIYQLPIPASYSHYERKTVSENSFGYYLRHIYLKPANTPVKLYNGQLKNYQDVHARILDISVGKRDLQQCADAVMRLWGEYLFKTNQKDKISFNYTSGDAANYQKWKNGYRPTISGNKVNWNLKAKVDTSYENFLNYMDNVFMYAGSASLSKELKSKKIQDMEIGDVFIHGGFPGHAVLVVDMAINPSNNKKIFLVAQSYMPAQDIHILKNFENETLSPWYEIPTSTTATISTPEWIFQQSDLKSFD